MRYRYDVRGGAAGGQSFICQGHVDAKRGDTILDTLNEAMQESFMQLTEGKAVYGQPGRGCMGPYSIRRFLLEAVV